MGKTNKVKGNINGYRFEKKPSKYDFSKENFIYKKEFLSEKFGKKKFYRKQERRIEKFKYRKDRLDYRNYKNDRRSLQLSKSMIIVIALIFFTISSSLLNADIVIEETTYGDFKYYHVADYDVEKIGNLFIETPGIIVKSISSFATSLSGLFSIENGSIKILDVFAKVFKFFVDGINSILKWIVKLIGTFPGSEDWGSSESPAPGGGGGGDW